jgi:ABC-2 type transport system permease protein
MRKYLQVFRISFAQEFVYRVNFIMWRFRNVLQIFLVFFLWDTVFTDSGRVIFGYDRTRILTYVFGLLIVRGLVLSARSVDVTGEISRGELSNYLIKPFSYFKYWLTRDMSSKALNIIFAIGETVILYLLLKPPFFIQTNIVFLISFAIALILAMLIYFILIFITSSVPFWAPEAAWGTSWFVTAVLVEFMSGALFPLDILPQAAQNVLNLTPFPYLIFFPMQVYLGKVSGIVLFRGIIVSVIWALILWLLLNAIWKRGLKAYQSHGR